MTKVLITGGTGVIGSQLTRLLLEEGHDVRHLSRTPAPTNTVPTFAWDPLNGTLDEAALHEVDTIIHLAGAGIADKKWTEERKRIIIDSRVKSTQLLRDTCKRLDVQLQHFISASAIGWYPLTITREVFDETAAPGNGFLADVCQQWEASADTFEDVSKRVSKLRVGLVLTRKAGLLAKVSIPVKYYLAAGLGSGKQAMPWIHLTDVCRAFKHVMEGGLDGVYNAVGPENATNLDFMQTLADVTEKPLLLPNVPEFMIKLFFGDQAEMILKGAPLSSKKLLDTGFSFDYPTLNTALSNIYLD